MAAELLGVFGRRAVTRLMAAVPPAGPPATNGAALNIKNFAERAVASVSRQRSTWTVWNLRAQAERLTRAAAETSPVPPGRCRSRWRSARTARPWPAATNTLTGPPAGPVLFQGPGGFLALAGVEVGLAGELVAGGARRIVAALAPVAEHQFGVAGLDLWLDITGLALRIR